MVDFLPGNPRGTPRGKPVTTAAEAQTAQKSVNAAEATQQTMEQSIHYFQTNIKRMLAYSTIAHAGYMLTGVAAMLVALANDKPLLAADCIEGVLF